MLIILLNILYFSIYIMKERHQKVEIPVRSQRKKLVWKREWIPAPVATKKEKEDGRSASWKRVWIINSLFKPNDECQHFGNMTAAKLRNYNDTIRCVIQNEIMRVFLNANRGFYERYHHTHLQPINPPQAHFLTGPSKMYTQSINPPPNTSLSFLFSKPFSAMFWKHFSVTSQSVQ